MTENIDARRAEVLRTAREIYDRTGAIDDVLEYVDGAIGELLPLDMLDASCRLWV